MKRVEFTNYFNEKPSKSRRLGVEILMATFLLLFLTFIVFAAFISSESKSYAESLPENEVIISKVTDNAQNSHIYDRNGSLLYVFSEPDSDREYVTFDEIPNNLKWALIVAEDGNFYSHNGLDYQAIFRSLLNIVSSEGDNVTGGSTITQQLVKNTVLTNERTVDRKIKEMLISFYLEKEYDKDYIIELYFNSASFGGRIKGVKVAARTYFNKNLDELTLEESVFLVSLVQRPGESSPLFSVDEERAWNISNARADYIFSQLKNHHSSIIERDPDFYTYEEIEASQSETISLDPFLGKIEAPHFVFYIKDMLSQEPYNISEEDLYTKGYRIHTSLNLDLQRIAERNLSEGIDRYQRYGMRNGGLVTIDPKTGDLLAMVGSKDYFGERDDEGKFDPQVNVTVSDQNLGSTLKPLITYEAINKGYYGPWSTIVDKPINYYGYRPKNYDGGYGGPMTVASALQLSRNTPFVQILDQISVWSFLDLMDDLGYEEAKNRDNYGLSIAIGGFNSNLLEHTHVTSAFANKGTLADLRSIVKVEDVYGNIYFENNIKTEEKLNPYAVNMVNSILLSYGPGGIAGKTGTTDENKDTFFIGYNHNFITGIWIGNNNNDRMARNAYGSSTAMPIWGMYYSEVRTELPEYAGYVSNTLPAPPKPKIIEPEEGDTIE